MDITIDRPLNLSTIYHANLYEQINNTMCCAKDKLGLYNFYTQNITETQILYFNFIANVSLEILNFLRIISGQQVRVQTLA